VKDMKVALLAAVVFATLAAVACGETSSATSSASSSPVLLVAVGPMGVIVDGRPVSLPQLDVRLSDLRRQGGSVWLISDRGSTASPSSAPQHWSKKQVAKAVELRRRVTALVDDHGVHLIASTMPVTGSASPSVAPRSDP
jgi:hypothetical protein